MLIKIEEMFKEIMFKPCRHVKFEGTNTFVLIKKYNVCNIYVKKQALLLQILSNVNEP